MYYERDTNVLEKTVDFFFGGGINHTLCVGKENDVCFWTNYNYCCSAWALYMVHTAAVGAFGQTTLLGIVRLGYLYWPALSVAIPTLGCRCTVNRRRGLSLQWLTTF